MAILKDEYGNDLISGDTISVGEYIMEMGEWSYEYGVYEELDFEPFIVKEDGKVRTLYLYDYIRITKPVNQRELYGYRKD